MTPAAERMNHILFLQKLVQNQFLSKIYCTNQNSIFKYMAINI